MLHRLFLRLPSGAEARRSRRGVVDVLSWAGGGDGRETSLSPMLRAATAAVRAATGAGEGAQGDDGCQLPERQAQDMIDARGRGRGCGGMCLAVEATTARR